MCRDGPRSGRVEGIRYERGPGRDGLAECAIRGYSIHVTDARIVLVLPYVGRSVRRARKLLELLDADLAGLSEICDDAGKGKTEVSNRARRADFPAPVARLACGPVYSRSTVRAYWDGPDVGSDVSDAPVENVA